MSTGLAWVVVLAPVPVFEAAGIEKDALADANREGVLVRVLVQVRAGDSEPAGGFLDGEVAGFGLGLVAVPGGLEPEPQPGALLPLDEAADERGQLGGRR